MEVKINAVQSIFAYEYNEDLGECKICKEPLNGPCMECKPFKDMNCVLKTGRCGHMFHGHCVGHWVEDHQTCPCCAQQWESVE